MGPYIALHWETQAPSPASQGPLSTIETKSWKQALHITRCGPETRITTKSPLALEDLTCPEEFNEAGAGQRKHMCVCWTRVWSILPAKTKMGKSEQENSSTDTHCSRCRVHKFSLRTWAQPLGLANLVATALEINLGHREGELRGPECSCPCPRSPPHCINSLAGRLAGEHGSRDQTPFSQPHRLVIFHLPRHVATH